MDPASPNIHWQSAMTAQGKPFEIGRLVAEGGTEAPPALASEASQASAAEAPQAIDAEAPQAAAAEEAKAEAAHAPALVAPRGKAPFGIKVLWEPQTGDFFHTASDEVRDKASIMQYDLKGPGAGVLFDYILNFINDEHYDYYFYDETGDSYHVNTWTSGEHFVRYNSKKPNIVFIKGS